MKKKLDLLSEDVNRQLRKKRKRRKQRRKRVKIILEILRFFRKEDCLSWSTESRRFS